MVDLVLAGDNAIVVGIVAAGLPREQRSKVILIGIAAATLLRVAFAVVTSQLLQIIGLTLAGGILLLWVCWKLWRELRQHRADHAGAIESDAPDPAIDAATPKTFRNAVIQTSSPTSRCRSTTCWRSPASPATTPGCWSSV